MFATLILCVTETYCKFTKTQRTAKGVIGTGLRLAVAVNFVGFTVSGRSYIYTHTRVCIMVTGFLFTNRSTTHTNSATVHNLLPACQTRNKLGPNLKSSLTPWAATCVAFCRPSSLVGLSNLGKPKNVKYNTYLILQDLCSVNQRNAHFSNCCLNSLMVDRRRQKFKNRIKAFIWKVCISSVCVAWLYHNAPCKNIRFAGFVGLILQ
jgi:hypothetical protein